MIGVNYYSTGDSGNWVNDMRGESGLTMRRWVSDMRDKLELTV